MKTYFGVKTIEGIGRVTVQCPGGEIQPLSGSEYSWEWGNGSGYALAVNLLDDAGVGTGAYKALYNERLVKLDPDAPFTIDWYELKAFADAAVKEKT